MIECPFLAAWREGGHGVLVDGEGIIEVIRVDSSVQHTDIGADPDEMKLIDLPFAQPQIQWRTSEA